MLCLKFGELQVAYYFPKAVNQQHDNDTLIYKPMSEFSTFKNVSAVKPVYNIKSYKIKERHSDDGNGCKTDSVPGDWVSTAGPHINTPTYLCQQI